MGVGWQHCRLLLPFVCGPPAAHLGALSFATAQELGAKPGWAVAAYFGYMKGTENELALRHVPEILPRNDTLAGAVVGQRGCSGCG